MPKTKRKTARKSSGRPTGSKNRAPRARRQLTPTQKLREHILIELGIDKKDIAAAIGTTHQTVSNIFYDEHRSIREADIVSYLRERYQQADQSSVANIDGYFHWFDFSSDPHGCPIRLDTMGWPKRAIEEAREFKASGIRGLVRARVSAARKHTRIARNLRAEG